MVKGRREERKERKEKGGRIAADKRRIERTRREIRNIRGRNALSRVDGGTPRERVPVRVVTRAPVLENRAPQMHATANKCIVSHREQFFTLRGLDLGVTGMAVRQPINPGNQYMFPWLSRVSQNYESYLFKKLKFEYITSSPTTIAGNVVMAVDFDPTDPAPDDNSAVKALNSFIGAVSAPIYTPKAEVHCRPANLHKRKSYFVTRTADVGDTQGATLIQDQIVSYNRSADTGQLMVALTAPADTAVGQLFVSYEIELLTPHYFELEANSFVADVPYPDANPTPGNQVNEMPTNLQDILPRLVDPTTGPPAFPYTNYDECATSSVLSGRWKGKNAYDNTTFEGAGIKLGYGSGSSISRSEAQERYLEFQNTGYYLLEGMTWTTPPTSVFNDDALGGVFPVNADNDTERGYMVTNSNKHSYAGSSTRGGIPGSDVYSRMVIAITDPSTKMYLRAISNYRTNLAPILTHTLNAVQTVLSYLGPLNSYTTAAAASTLAGWTATPLMIQALRTRALPAPFPLAKRIEEMRSAHMAPVKLFQGQSHMDVDEDDRLERSPSSIPCSVHDIEDLPPSLCHLTRFDTIDRRTTRRLAEPK